MVKEMNKRLKTRWVKALRSGKYAQGNGDLRTESRHGDVTYCCLGVLGALCKIPLESLNDEGTLDDVGRNDLLGPWSTESQSELSFDKKVKATHTTLQRKLAAMNDQGWSFKRISNWIEKNV